MQLTKLLIDLNGTDFLKLFTKFFGINNHFDKFQSVFFPAPNEIKHN